MIQKMKKQLDMILSSTGEKMKVEEHKPVVNDGPKVGRNDPCPCGSGKKYKNCCGKNQ